MSDLPTPVTREEQFLNGIAQGDTSNLPTPVGREEKYLDYIARNGGGGGGGTTNYNALDNKPQIAGTTLQGNKTLNDLGIASEDAIEDVYAVMGEMGAKNFNSYPYNETTHTDNGVDWTDNKDGTVTANNAATGNSTFLCHARQSASANRLIVPNGSYILTGCPTGGSDSTYRISANITKNGSAVGLGTDYGNGVIITVNGDDNYQDKAIIQIGCDVRNGYTASNLTFRPMLRLVSDTDGTYQPYAKTNKQLTDEIANKVDKIAGKGLSTNDYDNTEKGKVTANAEAIEAMVNVTGACNFAKNEAATKTHHGITFTVNADGSVTASGIADVNQYAYLDTMPKTDLPFGAYKGSGGINEHCRIIFGRSNSSGTLIDTVDDSGEGVSITVDASHSKISMAIIVDAGTDLTTPVTVYPMLYDARLTPTGYVPYAMTNRELTERATWHHIGYGADDGGEVNCSLNYSEFIFTMNTENINLLQTLIIPVDQTGHALYIMAYQSNTHNAQTRIDYDYSNSKFTFAREFLNGWNNIRIDVYAR